MNKYLISVIIPTRNRQVYAEAATRQILALNQDIQVIVHDNSDENILQESFVDLLDNNHLIYHHINERVAFIENYDLAASYAEGEYFIAIGDDDGLLCNITECVNWMKRIGIDVLKPSVKMSYSWPVENSYIQEKREGLFSTKFFSGKIKYYNTRDSIISLLEHGGQEYLNYPLAGTYHRIVKMDLMKRVKEITGKYYGGLTPDMYSAACLSLIPNIIFAEIDYPISIPGVCPASASAKSAKGEHSGKLETAPHFIGLKNAYLWDERIPYFYSVETIWAETLLKAIGEMGQGKLIDEYFNEDYLLLFLYRNNQNVKQDIEEIIGLKRIQSLSKIKIKKQSKFIRFSKRIVGYFIRRIPGNSLIIPRCKNISEAANEANKMIMSRLMRKKWNRLVKKSIREN